MGIQADTIISEPGNPQALNRYSYVLNNPLKYTDPTGHMKQCGETCEGEDKWSANVTLITHLTNSRYENAFNSLIWDAAQEAGISPYLLKGVVAAETGLTFDPTQKTGTAVGLMQIVVTTGRGLGLHIDLNAGIDERLDPAKNLVAGAKYIRQMLDKFNGATEDDHWKIAMTAYTAGPSTVANAQSTMLGPGKEWPYAFPNIYQHLVNPDASELSPLSVSAYANNIPTINGQSPTLPVSNAYVNNAIATLYIPTIAKWMK